MHGFVIRAKMCVPPKINKNIPMQTEKQKKAKKEKNEEVEKKEEILKKIKSGREKGS